MNINILIISIAILSFILSASIGKFLIPFLRKVNFGQSILEIGPKWHKSKQGTPVMGGLMFIFSISVMSIIFLPIYYVSAYNNTLPTETYLMFIKVVAGILMALAFALIGFFDDYTKIIKKRNLGLNIKQKLILQFIVAIGYFASLKLAGATSTTIIPFIGEVDLGWSYWILAILFLVGMANAVNFTDGIDGLNASVTFFVCSCMLILSSVLHCFGVSLLSAAAAGAVLGYLIWNIHPAKVFMGDVGSLFLGALVCALAFAINIPIILLLIGIIYVIEILSVVIQVSYFKITKGKRIFKMSPIHHHFEMSGWNESKICIIFSFITILASLLALLAVKFGI